MVWRAKYSAIGGLDRGAGPRRSRCSGRTRPVARGQGVGTLDAVLGDDAARSSRGSGRAPCRRAARTTRNRRASARSRASARCCAPRRRPRNPVFGNCAGVAMFATNTTSCIETSTRCGQPVRQRGERGERRFGAQSGRSPTARCSGPARGRDRRCSTCCRWPPSPRGPTPATTRAGRSRPNGVMLTHTASGARSGSIVERAGRARRVEHDVGGDQQRAEGGVVGPVDQRCCACRRPRRRTGGRPGAAASHRAARPSRPRRRGRRGSGPQARRTRRRGRPPERLRAVASPKGASARSCRNFP